MVPDDARTLAEQWEPLPRHAKAELLAHTQARATKFRRKFREAKGQLDRHRYSSIGTTKSIVYNISRLRSQLEAMMNSVTEYTPPPVLGHSQNALSVEELKSLQDAQGFLMTVAEAQDGIDQKFNEEAATGMRNKAYLLAKVKKETGALREAFAAMLPAGRTRRSTGCRTPSAPRASPSPRSRTSLPTPSNSWDSSPSSSRTATLPRSTRRGRTPWLGCARWTARRGRRSTISLRGTRATLTCSTSAPCARSRASRTRRTRCGRSGWPRAPFAMRRGQSRSSTQRTG